MIGYVTDAKLRFRVRGVKQYKGLDGELNGTYEVIGNVYEPPKLMEDENNVEN